MAGLEAADAGEIALDGREGETAGGLPGDIRVMFRDSRLLPWKRVLDNVALGLPRERRGEAARVLDQVGPAERAGEWPARLSGGQRQRVALARALVHHPRLLLLDEPLGALDALTRIEMQALIESLWRRLGFTALLVTHDVSEAIATADRVVLIEDGRITLDHAVALARPRQRGSAAFAELEDAVLRRVMRRRSAAPRMRRRRTGARRAPTGRWCAASNRCAGRSRPRAGWCMRRGASAAFPDQPCRASARIQLYSLNPRSFYHEHSGHQRSQPVPRQGRRHHRGTRGLRGGRADAGGHRDLGHHHALGQDLGLTIGSDVVALVKATEVSVAKL